MKIGSSSICLWKNLPKAWDHLSKLPSQLLLNMSDYKQYGSPRSLELFKRAPVPLTLSQGGQLRPIRRYTHRAAHNGILSSVVITHPFPVSRPSTLPQLRFQALVISPNHRQKDMCGDRAVHLFSGY